MRKLLAVVLVVLVAAAAGAWDIIVADDYVLLWRMADYYEGSAIEPPSLGVRSKDGVVEVVVDFGGPRIAYPRDRYVEVLVQIGDDGYAEEMVAAVAVGDRSVFLDTSVALDMASLGPRDIVRIGAWPVDGSSIWGEWRIEGFPRMLRRFMRIQQASGVVM